MLPYIPPIPPLPDLARIEGECVAEAFKWVVEFYNALGAPFNYRSASRVIRTAYRGVHRLDLLTAGCCAEKTRSGRSANTSVVTLAAPVAFGRATQVFDLSPRRFHFGQNRSAAYRIPFLFVENGTIYVYYLQPRKFARLTFDQLCMVATVVKTYLLDTEFYGERCDVEFVDVGAPDGKHRELRRLKLSDMHLWSEARLADRLTLINEALDLAFASGLIEPRRRLLRRPEPEMPLFD